MGEDKQLGIGAEEGSPRNWPKGWGWNLKVRWVGWRNRLLRKPGFQRWMTIVPFTRPAARGRARQLFDLLAGFTYTQTLLAFVESGLLDLLERGPADAASIGHAAQLSKDAALRLVRAATAIDLAEEVAPGWWMLGEQGAALHSNHGAQAMIRHHKLLYTDLADPLALLHDDRQTPTALSQFWTYAGTPEERSRDPEKARAYSELMAASQHLVAEQVLPAYDFSKHVKLLDIGGGHGAFLGAVANRHARLKLGLYDLPQVAAQAVETAHLAPHRARVATFGGDFFEESLPKGYDLISLVRILHDHDDAPAQKLLGNIHKALAPGARLLIAEPMAETAGAKGMGDAYFGLYLWAMRSGRPRSAAQITAMLERAGFASTRQITTRQPLVASIIVARA